MIFFDSFAKGRTILIYRTLSLFFDGNMIDSNLFTKKWLLGLCFICCAISDCQSPHEPSNVVVPAFYHWQTQLRLSSAEQNYLASLHVKKLYVKFFDVDWDETSRQPIPLASVEIDTIRLTGLEIVPTIFITNRCLLNLPMLEVDSLAGRIFQKINSLAPNSPSEIQFDCDWTEQTQARFFALLTSFKERLAHRPPTSVHSPTLLSATIRLHQLKYSEKTGVPPVDRGMLMCYNMGDLDDWTTENSILDTEILKSYLSSSVNYPLPLDMALPLFRWGVLFRDGRLVKLLKDLSEADLQDTSRFNKTATNRYEVKKSTYLQAHYLYAGDQLRLEAVSAEALAAATDLVNPLRSGPPTTIAFYHLDSTIVSLFSKKNIQETLGRMEHQ